MEKKAPYDAREIAKYIIDYCNNKGYPITNLRLQKTLYFVWVDYYKRTRCHLFNNAISAWYLGPVVTDVYYEYRIYAGLPIWNEYPDVAIDTEDKRMLNETVDFCNKKTVKELVDITHTQGKPWDKTFLGGQGNRRRIEFSLIKTLECGDDYES